MLTKSERRLYDTAHESNITRLIREYGETDPEMVMKLYGLVRGEHEIDATVLQFVPIGTLRDFRDRYPINDTASAIAANL